MNHGTTKKSAQKNEIIHIHTEFQAPDELGSFEGSFSLMTQGVQFGPKVKVSIKVIEARQKVVEEENQQDDESSKEEQSCLKPEVPDQREDYQEAEVQEESHVISKPIE